MNKIVIIVQVVKILTLSLILQSPAKTEKLNTVRILNIKKNQLKENS